MKDVLAAAREAAAVAELADQLGRYFETHTLPIPCPKCGAPAGEWCQGEPGAKDRRAVCRERYEAGRDS